LNIEKLIQHVKKSEGTGPHDSETDTYRPYRDSVGKLTIGYGHNLDDRGLDGDVVEHQLRNDINLAMAECKGLDVWDGLDDARRMVLVDMCFNMGLSRLKTFKKMFAALRLRDYKLAATEMLDSKWAKQVGRRARKLSRIMRDGHWAAEEQKWE